MFLLKVDLTVVEVAESMVMTGLRPPPHPAAAEDPNQPKLVPTGQAARLILDVKVPFAPMPGMSLLLDADDGTAVRLGAVVWDLRRSHFLSPVQLLVDQGTYDEALAKLFAAGATEVEGLEGAVPAGEG